MCTKGIVFDIQKYSIHDGPGIRTTVFLKGCNLRCFWCHNPESIETYPEIQFTPLKCIGCRKCVEVCPYDARKIINGEMLYLRDLCRRCGKCIKVCAAQATEWVGVEMSVEDVMKEIERDLVFYKRSGGGVTISGGEPLLQTRFLKNLLNACKEKDITTALDTNGNIDWENFNEVIPLVDLFLYDIKLINDEKHKKYTGASNKIILDNLKKIINLNKKIVIRIPVIPGVNASIDEMEKISSFLTKFDSIVQIELLAFHKLGSGKNKKLGKKDFIKNIDPPDVKMMREFSKIFSRKKLNVKKI